MGRPLSLLTTTSMALKGRTVPELDSHMNFITLCRQALITLVIMPLPDGLTVHLNIHSQVYIYWEGIKLMSNYKTKIIICVIINNICICFHCNG
jgi:hypothetical protein